MWEQEEFAKHWRNEFPHAEVPRMDLSSVEDIESELESCKANLKRLQKALAEEKFKVLYLQTTVAQQKRNEPERFEGKDENFNAETFVVPKVENVKLGLRREDGGMKFSGAANTPSSYGRERSRFIGKTGKYVPIPVPPQIHRRGVKAANDNEEEDSDREYEDAELNENFVRNNLLKPKSVGKDSSQRMPIICRDNLRPFRHSRDFDSGDDGRLSPSLPHVLRRTSRGSGCSTPDRRSDGYLSSDHDDDSSAGGSNYCFSAPLTIICRALLSAGM
ncbi:hypothetical protein ILYODFUR_015836 [Ilyodon furcidens]|uniref:Bcr-Abl oncoprotein oligomerisation domain-containing protein n=1 Tax=Ilyodon furcidens TaxID=33524 RepID=A0ABV0TXT9_9TELE